jgi:hypothetical protein
MYHPPPLYDTHHFFPQLNICSHLTILSINNTGGRQIHPETSQNHNATLLKLHLTTCFTLPQCSENIQQISKFLSQIIRLGPSRVSNHILHRKNAIYYNVSLQSKTIDLPHAFYPGSLASSSGSD